MDSERNEPVPPDTSQTDSEENLHNGSGNCLNFLCHICANGLYKIKKKKKWACPCKLVINSKQDIAQLLIHKIHYVKQLTAS